MHTRRLVLLPAFCAVLAASAAAQDVPELTVTGVVRTADGTALPGARAALRRLPANHEALRRRLDAVPTEPPLSHSTTGADGRYRLAVPAPGVYTVEIAASGFVTVSYQVLP